MHTNSVNRLVAAGGSWFKSCAARWFGGAKPIVGLAKPATVPLSNPIAQLQTNLVTRWNLSDRLNQYAERNRLIDVYTRQYRRYVMPFPRPGIRGFGTLLGFAAFAPALRNVDSKDTSTDAWDACDGLSTRDWVGSSMFSKSHFVDSYKDLKPHFDANVRKLDELVIVRRANANDGPACVLPGAFDVFLAKRNRVADTNTCQITELEVEVEESIEVAQEEAASFEPVGHYDVEVDNASAADGFSVVEDPEEPCPLVSVSVSAVVCDKSKNERSLHHEFCELESSSTRECDYSVIVDEDAAEEEQVALTRLTSTHHQLQESVLDRSFVEVESIGETVFEVDKVPASRGVTRCDFELESGSKTKVKMRDPADSRGSPSVNERTHQWLRESPSHAPSESSVASRGDVMLRNLYEVADYLVYAYRDRRAIPAQLTNMDAYARCFHSIAPRLSIIHAPVCSVLGDQIAVVASSVGTDNRVGGSLRVNRRARLANASGVIRSLCTFATLNRMDENAGDRLFGSERRLETPWVVRQRPVGLRRFLRELELEILDSRALARHVQSCARAFDATLLQLLEFGWSSLVEDRLGFVSFDFERLLDALGVEFDATGAPHLVPLGDMDSFESLFAPAARSDRNNGNGYESFASLSFVVYLNVRRVIDALELATAPTVSTWNLRCCLMDALCSAREENIGDLRVLMDQLRAAEVGGVQT